MGRRGLGNWCIAYLYWGGRMNFSDWPTWAHKADDIAKGVTFKPTLPPTQDNHNLLVNPEKLPLVERKLADKPKTDAEVLQSIAKGITVEANDEAQAMRIWDKIPVSPKKRGRPSKVKKE